MPEAIPDVALLVVVVVQLLIMIWMLMAIRKAQTELHALNQKGPDDSDFLFRQQLQQYLQQQMQQQNQLLEQLRSSLMGELTQNRLEQQQNLQGAMQGFGESINQRQQQVAEVQDKRLAELTQQLGSRQETLQTTTSSLLQQVSDAQSKGLAELTQQLGSRQETLQTTTSSLLQQVSDAQSKGLAELTQQLGSRQETLQTTTTQLLKQMETRLQEQNVQNDSRLEQIRQTMERRLTAIQEDNSTKLEQMRQTVDEKLQKTLEERIGQSFKLVSERLEQVYKGLGEMQTLATGVGDLQRVLSNVKTRGILGEYQLGAILENILSSNQYYKNAQPRPGSSNTVEYAVRLPGLDDGEVLLPIDAKFPADVYSRLMEAYEAGNTQEIEAAGTQLDRSIRNSAKEIREKYIEPPYTTDFAVMFLPFEGLYAEVVRRGLLEELMQVHKVVIAGPTTIAALLNSLHMGFKTLAIQKHSGEVWKVLEGVKSEFGRFGEALAQTQRRMEQTSKELETLVGVRSRQMQRQLAAVIEPPQEEKPLADLEPRETE